MQQLTQKLKSGKMQIIEAPIPDLKTGMILVRNFYSLISAGTEGSTVRAARKGYIGKAMERPQQVKQVIDTLKTQGPIQTYRAVMKKLDAYSPLGYSCVGEVIDVACDVDSIKVGDFVACGGQTASHAEVVAVPCNLCVKLLGVQEAEREGRPEEYLKAAAYNTLGAIALQGIRQADLHLGECCLVLGLGLLGQLTAILLKASGIKVIGVDIDENMVNMAAQHCLDLGLMRGTVDIENRILEFTHGVGCDAVIITAASDSLDPINFAGSMARKKGTIVVVGAVPTGFDREPHFYKKELTVKMSCSYGPGRYDPEYEEKGRDYPIGYVRWTENRNMQAFQEFLASGKIDISHLTTHVFKLENAPAAYDMILEKSEPYIGILIEYDRAKEIKRDKVIVHRASQIAPHASRVTIGFIGAGSYAQSYLLPNIPKIPELILKGVMTASSTSSRSVAERFGFEFCTGKEGDILEDPDINTVFVATRHDTHAEYVIRALKAGKHVFVEKPLCITEAQLQEIILTYRSLITNNQSPILMVGFNRRFSPLAKIIREKLGTGTMSMIYRINAGPIPTDSWVQDREVGGGRILSEVCHFVDYLTYSNGSLPTSVYAVAIDDPHHNYDTLTVSLGYENGSIGSIQYFSNGSKSLAKEYVEIYKQGITVVLNDFRELIIYGKGKLLKKKHFTNDKGQKDEVRAFIDIILNGRPSLIPAEEIFNTTEVVFKIIESIRIGQTIKLKN